MYNPSDFFSSDTSLLRLIRFSRDIEKLPYDEPGELESLNGGTMPINELEERAKTLRLELAQQQDENEKLKEENQRLNEEVEKGRRENGELRGRNGDLEQRNRDLEERWNEVQERLGPYNR